MSCIPGDCPEETQIISEEHQFHSSIRGRRSNPIYNDKCLPANWDCIESTMCRDQLQRNGENATYLWQICGKRAARETCSLHLTDQRAMYNAKFLPEYDMWVAFPIRREPCALEVNQKRARFSAAWAEDELMLLAWMLVGMLVSSRHLYWVSRRCWFQAPRQAPMWKWKRENSGLHTIMRFKILS